MNRTIHPPQLENQLRGNFALLCFVAEGNLQKIVRALDSNDLSALAKASERNQKIGRLRAEIEEEILEQLSQNHLTTEERSFLLILSHLARMLVQFGEETVLLATAAQQLNGGIDPMEKQSIKNLLDHAVLMTDLGMVALMEGKKDKCLLALQRRSAAESIWEKIVLQNNQRSSPNLSGKSDQKFQLMITAKSLVDQSGQMAAQVDDYLENYSF